MTNTSYDTEIELFKIAEELWAGKWILFKFILIFMIMGAGFFFYKSKDVPKQHYLVTAPYSINLHPFLSQQMCFRDLNCMARRMSDQLSKVVADEWKDKTPIHKEWEIANIDLSKLLPKCAKIKITKANNHCLVLHTYSPKEPEQYIQELGQYNRSITDKILIEAEMELNVLRSNNNKNINGTEELARNIIEIKRLILAIKNKEMAVNFGSINVTVIDPPIKIIPILILSFFLGSILGTGYLFIKIAFQNRLKSDL